MGAHLVESADQRLDVGVGEVAGEVLFDRVPVVAAGLLHRPASLIGEDDEDRAAVVLGPDAADEAGIFHAVDDAGEAALAVENPLGELGHPEAVCLLELDQSVVPPQWDPGVALELGFQHVEDSECALEIETPSAQPLRRGA